MNRLKVLQFPIAVSKGGITQYCLNNWKFIDKNKFKFDFVTFSKSINFANEIERTGSIIHYASCRAEENESEFIMPMNEFIVKYRLMDKIKSKIEKIKGQTFFEKVIEEFSSSGEKIIKLLYYFILYIEESQKKFDFPNIKKSFIAELEKFELKGLDKNLSFEIKDKDKKRLIIWIENELDDSSIFEIISNIEEIKKMLKNELNFVNKIIVNFLYR